MASRKRAFIHPQKCRKCGVCHPANFCPANAIEREDDNLSYVTPDCVGCRKCIQACTAKIIEMI